MSTPTYVRLTRVAKVPDGVRIARSQRAPELGPRILFLSGGSALRPLSRVLKQYTHNSIHLITAFDSGGSSAQLRRAFAMPAIGDLRNRIVALADESVRGNPEIYRLFCFRLAAVATPAELRSQLSQMVDGTHPLVDAIHEPMRQIVRTHLRFFCERMPGDFDLSGANVGNLMLAGGYLANSRNLDSVLFLFSKLLEVRGVVRPIVDVDLHLCAELENEQKVVGQHRITGKEVAPLRSAVRQLTLVDGLESRAPASTAIGEQVRRQIASADLICLPMGSFYSSVVANLLPQGVGRTIAAAGVPRVYIPNMGTDPEQYGMTLEDSLKALAEYVRKDSEGDIPLSDIINFVILDERDESYSMKVDRESIRRMGVEVISLPLASRGGPPHADPERLAHVLLSLT